MGYKFLKRRDSPVRSTLPSGEQTVNKGLLNYTRVFFGWGPLAGQQWKLK